MIWKKNPTKFRYWVGVFAVAGAVAAILVYGASINNAVAKADTGSAAPAATFPGSGVGTIADGGVGCSPSPGTPLNVSFNVTGIPSAPSAVSVDMTFGSPNHTWMGDIVATLIAPDATTFTVFGRTGATTAAGVGDSSDLGALYNFSDVAPTPPSGGWWQEATARGTTEVMTTGTYRTTGSGGAGATNPMPATNLTAAFAGIPTSNGTWTLRFTDGCSGDTGAVTAANLTLTGGAAVVKSPLDYNGDGKTDYTVVRNTGGGPSGQVTWYTCYNGTAEPGCWQFQQWGLASDFFVAGDFDGDGKDDLTVWRPAPATQAAFYIFQSQSNTVRTDFFGQTGDDPTVVGDYTGDGKADPAVYRAGASAGQQSFFYYRASSGTFNGQIVFEPWGQNGDFPAPGDYDGDGKYDFLVQRNSGIGGQAIFWQRINGSNAISNFVFGLATDVIAPGDYDGDGKTDVCVIRGISGNINWFYRPSTAPSTLGFLGAFGLSATDFPTQGDYNGDGKTDVAVWRPNADPTQVFFHVLATGSGAYSRFEWGNNGDYPVANFNTH